MCVLPRWHTQRCGRCQNSRYFYRTARDADYLLDADYVFGQNITEDNPAPDFAKQNTLCGFLERR